MSATIPARYRLEGVPPIGDYEYVQKYDPLPRCPESVYIPAAIRSVMEYLGQGLGCHKAGQPGSTGEGDLACGYAFLMGVSGAAFYTCWDVSWMEDCVSVIYMGHDFETTERRCYGALGYSYEWITPRPGVDEKPEWLALIVKWLSERHAPVLSYGVIGPPEPSIVTGWDEGGEVLTGWSHFQHSPVFASGVEFEPDGQFRKRNWMEGNLNLLLIGEKKPRPDARQVYRDSLEWALQVCRTARFFPEPDAPQWVAHKWNGLAALTAWGGSLLDDANFADAADGVGAASLRQHLDMHINIAATLAEERAMADVFLRQIAAREPAVAPELIQAGRLYREESDLAGAMQSTFGGVDTPEALRTFSDSGVRRALAGTLAELRAKEEQAVSLLEQALAKWN